MKIHIFNFVLIFLSIQLSAQTNQHKKGVQDYQKLAYVDAIQNLEKAVQSGKLSKENIPSTYQMIADSYYNNAMYDEAKSWYYKIYAEYPNHQDQKYLIRYAITQKSNQNYIYADELLKEAQVTLPNDSRIKKTLNNPNYLQQINHRKDNFVLEQVNFNSVFSDYGPAYFDQSILFTSTRDTTFAFTRFDHTWTGKSFSNLFLVNDSVGKVVPFSKKINTIFNESTPVFTADFKKMYFTRNNFTDREKGYDENNRINLKIYFSEFKDNQWSEAIELPFNNNQYNCAHPAISADGKWLYFASDMNGVKGDSNLFRVEILGSNTFSTPENLGAKINTEGRESFPFVDANGNLYFASDGHPGLGGFDLFVANVNPNGTFQGPINLGPVINSPKDDFALIMNQQLKGGYFSSNRIGGVGNDDVYKFKVNSLLVCEQQIVGIVRDQKTLLPIAGSRVQIFDQANNLIGEIFSDSEGKYEYKVACSQQVKIIYQKEFYTEKQVLVTIDDTTGITNQEVVLSKLPLTENEIAAIKITDKNDLSKILKLENIYFDLAKWDIRNDAAVQLEKIAALLKQTPTIKIVIRSHTDSRDSFKNNQVLSENRAQSTRNWLIDKGIQANRIQAKGFGEKHLFNYCTDTIECSEQEHQLNRRSEFIIIED